LVAIGMLMSFARAEPGAAQALAARRVNPFRKTKAKPAPRTRTARASARKKGRSPSRRPGARAR
jgi:hypothetical protein